MTGKEKTSESKRLKRGKRKVAKEILALTMGLTGGAIDLAVLAAALGGGFFVAGPRGKDLYADYKIKKALKITEWIYKAYKKSRFRQAIARATAKGYLARTASGLFSLTNEGRERLAAILPDYKKPFEWDGQLWLVTYDIYENQKHLRDALRDRLEQIGCGMIQKSVWLSLKDPRKWLSDFVKDYELEGQVIVSHLGQDGAIGEENIESFVGRVFKIKELGERYEDWIKDSKEKEFEQFPELALEYLAILRDDPVLPAELLPDSWAGNKARRIFENQIAPFCPDLAAGVM